MFRDKINLRLQKQGVLSNPLEPPLYGPACACKINDLEDLMQSTYVHNKIVYNIACACQIKFYMQ